MKKTTRQKHFKQRHLHERGSIRERSPGGIKFQPPAAGAAAGTAAKELKLPLSQFDRTQDATSVGEQAIPPATETALDHKHEPFTQRDLGTRAAADDKPASVDTAALNHATAGGNGELLPIDSLQSLAPEQREIVRQSDAAFSRVRQTWQCWKEVRAGLAVLRDLAMHETGANSPMSKLYKNRFHETARTTRVLLNENGPVGAKGTFEVCGISTQNRRMARPSRGAPPSANSIIQSQSCMPSANLRSRRHHPNRPNTRSNLRRLGKRRQLPSQAGMNALMNCSNRSTTCRKAFTYPIQLPTAIPTPSCRHAVVRKSKLSKLSRRSLHTSSRTVRREPPKLLNSQWTELEARSAEIHPARHPWSSPRSRNRSRKREGRAAC